MVPKIEWQCRSVKKNVRKQMSRDRNFNWLINDDWTERANLIARKRTMFSVGTAFTINKV